MRREPIIIYRQFNSVDSAGSIVVAWAEVETCYGSIRQATSREVLRAGQMGLTITHQIYVSGAIVVVFGDRAEIGGTTYDVVSGDNVDGIGRLTQIQVRSVKPS